MLRRWHSATAVLLLLSEELQQMRDFIDSLRVRRTVYKPSLDLNDLEVASGNGVQVRRGSDGLDSMDKALRLVCDHLDALVTVCDAVLHDCASELFADDCDAVPECLIGSPVVRGDEVESEMEDKKGVEDCIRLQTENRQMFDQLVDTIRQVENTGIRYSSPEVAIVQTQRTEKLQSREYSQVDTDHISESTEANWSHESSYTTCDRYSSGSTSPNVRIRMGFEEMSTDFTSAANKAQFYSEGDNELGESNIDKCSQIHAKVSEDAGVLDAEVQTFRSAMELLSKEKRLLQLQQRSNVTLHHELMKLSDENRKLHDIISELRTSLDRKNNEVLSLTEKADHVGRLLDEQVEEFRCVFRAVSRENDEEVNRLTAENSKLKSVLESLSTKDDSSDREEIDDTASRGMHEAIIHENVACAVPEKMQTKGFLDNGRSVGVGPETEDEVSSQQSSVVLCEGSIEPEELVPPQGPSLVVDCHKPDLVVPVYCIDDLWSEIDALKKMVPERGFHMGENVEEDGRLHAYKDWKDSVAVTHYDSNDTVAVDERGMAGHESTHLPFETDGPFCGYQSRNLSSNTPMMSPRGISLQNGNDLHGNRKDIMMEGKLTTKPLSELNTSKNEVETSRVDSQYTPSMILDKLQNSRLPDMTKSSPVQTSSLSRSFSDSCLLPKSYTSDGIHLTHNTTALSQAKKPGDECELGTGIRRAVCGGSAVDIFTEVPNPGKEKQLKSGQTVPVEWLQNNHDSDHLIENSSTSFVPEWCVQESATERSSMSLLSAEFFPCISPLPYSRPNERPSLSDLVLQMRHQNARLACYLSVVKSLHRQWDCNQTTDHNDQLQTHVPELPEFTHPQQHGDNAAAASAMLLPTTHQPFPVLSVVCLERPLVVDLTTHATALDSDAVTSLRNKLQVGYAITV